MELPNLQSIAGLLIAAYLLTFVFFAILRIFTGISIQRLGFSSIRHIAYAPGDGLKIEARGVGIKVHRPTFAQPTWISLVIEDLKVVIDIQALRTSRASSQDSEPNGSADPGHRPKLQSRLSSAWHTNIKSKNPGGRFWTRLIDIKNKVKRLHRIISWLRLVDVLAQRSSCVIIGVGSLQVGTAVASVDTRRATVDRSKLFQHKKGRQREQWPAEWTFAVRNVLLEPEGEDTIEIVDLVILNVHGFLRPQTEGLRDASVSLKIGRLHLPYDEFKEAQYKLRFAERTRKRAETSKDLMDPSIPSSPSSPRRTEPEEEQNDDQSALPSVLTDARDFVSSTLRGIREVSLAVGFLGTSLRVDSVRPAGAPLYINASIKEIGMDLYRLDPTTPEHSMYFSRSEVAHQALVTALSASVGLDMGHDHPDRLIYVPMITATIRTTLPSKILQFSFQDAGLDLNSNVLFANLVITSPSIDLDPAHLPIVLAALRSNSKRSRTSRTRPHSRLASKLLPRAIVSLSVHEPVVRVALPPVDSRDPDDFEFDLLIAAVSSVSVDLDSAHNSAQDLKYNATVNLRVASHRLYYQTTSRETHDLLTSDSLTMKSQITSDPQVLVVASVQVHTLSLFMVRPEIAEGIRQIIHQLRSDVKSDKLRRAKSSREPNPVRAFPAWLHHLDLQASDLDFEVAGIDQKLSSLSRGVALHLESFSTEYKAHKDDELKRPPHRRRGGSQSIRPDSESPRPQSPTSKARVGLGGSPTDGRRVAVHLKGLESYIIESASHWEAEPFFSLPQAEVAFTTVDDGQGPVLHINALVKSVYIQYSLFRHYALGVVYSTLRKTLSKSRSTMSNLSSERRGQAQSPERDEAVLDSSIATTEFISVDARITYLQIKTQLPEDPSVMLQLAGLESARHRWHTPYARSRVARLFAESPGMKRKTWSRVVSIKNPRIDSRTMRRKQGSNIVAERSLDVVTDAIRVGIPSQLVVHKIFDNFVNTVKTVAQLHHRFQTESDEYILEKYPEGPKKVPRISLRTQTFLFEIEDAPFEWKLGCIFKTGLIEQKQRMAREEAFQIKCKALKSSSKLVTSMFRSKSHQSRSRGRSVSQSRHRREGSIRHGSARVRNRSASQSMARGRSMRYDKEGTHGLSGTAQTSVDQAWQRLQKYNAQTWKKRIDQALDYQKDSIDEVRDLFWGSEEFPEDAEKQERILQLPRRPALATVLMSDLFITIDKPSFPMSDLPDFLHRVGKGLPKETEFSLLVPLHAQFDVGELRASLRDYPLPVLHIPSLRPGQSPKLSSFSLKTDFVIAEEFRDAESTRDLSIVIVPADKMKGGDRKSGGFAVDVRRTVSPVKTYSDIKLDVHTARDTRVTWGTSYQPAIQDTMQVIEGFTKPQVDPSEKVGFWDKIRLSFHSRIHIAWVGGGDVHLTLKGARDPYKVTGHGAGFMLIWRNNVRWSIREDDDPRNFLMVDSGDFVLAIPDFSKYARKSPETPPPNARGVDRSQNSEDVQSFKKVVMKLSGKVCWKAGLVFERSLADGTRSFDFAPHYDLTLKNPAYAKQSQPKIPYDAFRDFRSNYIHMSISVSAPSDRQWSVTNLDPSTNYNAVHLTPRFFTHFFAWWDMFSGIMSLPIHQGRLFPSTEKSGKKFGRHLATIKYSLLLSPLYISHIYLHKDAEEFTEDTVSATGLKMRLDSFMLDIHQRREEFISAVRGLNSKVTTTGMRINQALLDLVKADLRAVSVGIEGTSLDTVKRATAEELAEFQSDQRPVALSGFHIPDGDFSWVDVDDFVEIDWALPHNHSPKTSILPLGYSPRFTYRRQTDHGHAISGDSNRKSPWGNEDTHYCIMSPSNDSRRVQRQLVRERLAQIDSLLLDHNRAVGDQELHAVREVDNVERIEQELKDLQQHGDIFHGKRRYLLRMMDDLQRRINQDDTRTGSSHSHQSFPPHHEHDSIHEQSESDPHDDPSNEEGATEHVSDFNNRFVVHNAQLKWGNSLRNIMLRYIHQVSQRRGFVYYTSRRAVKFILDIIEEQRKSHTQPSQKAPDSDEESPQSPLDGSDDEDVQARIEELLKDGKQFVNADDPVQNKDSQPPPTALDTNEDVSQDFIVQNVYHVRLVAPQIQLQSEKNPKSVILVAGRGMRLQVFQIMDKDRMSDEVSGLVQTRFSLNMDNLQFFVTSKKTFSPKFLPIYSGNSYGTATGSQWPPWAPMEAMFDFQVRTYGFERVVQRTSATLRYDKYNKLRLKYNDSVTEGKDASTDPTDATDTRMDHFSVDFPQLRAICDSAQYYAMYIIVLDLLMWNEPLEKTRNERLEKIMLAADFSDLRGAPEMVMTLQNRIRALEEIKTHFHVNEKYLDRQGLEDRISMEQDLATCEDELFFIMKAITTSQRKVDERVEGAQASGVLKYYISASEIVWHLIKEAGQPLAEFQLRSATFERTDNSDGSNHNSVGIHQAKGLSLLPNAHYPEIISAYNEHAGPKPREGHSHMFQMNWYQLEAIAGINVVDHFEVDLHPLRIQLDYETGRKLFEYVFPGAGTGEEGFSPFMVKHQLPQTEEEDDEDEQMATQAQHEAAASATKDNPSGSMTGAGSLQQRLQPTRALPDYNRGGSTNRAKSHGLGINLGDHQRPSRLRREHSTARSIRPSGGPTKTLVARSSADNISVGGRSARDRQQSLTPNTAPSSDTPSSRKRFHMKSSHRSTSTDSRRSKLIATDQKSDDLTQMLNRASNYMTLAYIKIPSVVLCLSYKGRAARNVEDVHQLVFRMPTLEYRNKTWSNLDLAMALKKDVIRALISHTGAILNNKFSKHKYGKSQQSRLRELASSAVVLSSTEVSRAPSAASSVRHLTPGTSDADPSPRHSDAFSDASHSLVHTDTLGSGLSDLGDAYAEHEVPSDVEEEEDVQSVPEPSRRATFTRQFSELTQKAAGLRKTFSDESGAGGGVNGHANGGIGSGTGHRNAGSSRRGSTAGGSGTGASGNAGGEEETTPRRTRLVKKLMRPLQKEDG